jgi:hypothetical protein
VSRFRGIIVSKFKDFIVSKNEGFKVARFQVFEVKWFIGIKALNLRFKAALMVVNVADCYQKVLGSIPG